MTSGVPLDSRQRERIVELIRMGMPYREIANVCGVCVATVKNMAAQLRKELDK